LAWPAPCVARTFCSLLIATTRLDWRGVRLEEILLFWGGDEQGNHFSGPVQDFPFCIPVGSQAPHAAGVAYAFKLRKEPRVAVCLFG